MIWMMAAAIIWTNANIWSTKPLGISVSEIKSNIYPSFHENVFAIGVNEVKAVFPVHEVLNKECMTPSIIYNELN